MLSSKVFIILLRFLVQPDVQSGNRLHFHFNNCENCYYQIYRIFFQNLLTLARLFPHLLFKTQVYTQSYLPTHLFYSITPLFLFQTDPPMKKYQLWLQRKSYSQHLINLVKIKTSIHTPDNIQRKHRKIPTNPSPLQSPDTADLHEQRLRESSHLGDISYPILNRQLKRKKLQLLRSFEIEKENQSMARRMKQVKSVLNLHHPPFLPNAYLRRKTNEKKYEQSNDELRQSKFRKYIKWQSNTVSSLHPYYLTIEILNLGRLIRIRDDFAGLWCQVQTQRGTVRSDINDLNSYASYKYCFPLECDMGDKVLLRLFTCKGIESEKIGSFQVQRPRSAEKVQGWYRSSEGRFEIQLRVKYNKVIRNKPCVFFK